MRYIFLHNILTVKQVTVIQSGGSGGLALMGSTESRKPLKHLSIHWKLHLNIIMYCITYHALWTMDGGW